jgi:hypothetical protein
MLARARDCTPTAKQESSGARTLLLASVMLPRRSQAVELPSTDLLEDEFDDDEVTTDIYTRTDEVDQLLASLDALEVSEPILVEVD